MMRSDYEKAASVVHQYHRNVLNDLTDEILASDNPATGKRIDKILESYSHKLWQITACLDQLKYAGDKHEPSKPAQVAEIGCSRDSVTILLADWFGKNPEVRIISVSILDNVDELTCIIVYYPSC